MAQSLSVNLFEKEASALLTSAPFKLTRAHLPTELISVRRTSVPLRLGPQGHPPARTTPDPAEPSVWNETPWVVLRSRRFRAPGRIRLRRINPATKLPGHWRQATGAGRLVALQLKNIRSISLRNFARKKFATMIAMKAFTKASVVARPTPDAPARHVNPL